MIHLHTLLLSNNASLVSITNSYLSFDVTDSYLQINVYELTLCNRVTKKGDGCLVYASKNMEAEIYSCPQETA